MEFYSRSSYPQTIPHPKSKKIIDTYSIEINKDTGKKELKATGKTNIYEFIQKSLEDTKVYNILKKCEMGDTEALNRAVGAYGDFTSAPRSLAEAQQLIINAEKEFNSLPLEIRKEFNYSVSEFLAGFGNGKVSQVLEARSPKQEVEIQPIPTQPAQQVQPTQPTQSQSGGIKYE